MQPTSTAQFEAWNAGAVAGLEQVRDGIWTVGLAMPGDRIPCTLVALVADDRGGLHVIDPATDSDANSEVLTAAVDAIGHRIADIRSIVVTHLHPDHVGMAERMRAASGAPITLHRAEQAAIDRLAATTSSADDERVRLDGWGVPEERQAELLAVRARRRAVARVAADVLVDDGDVLDIPGRRMRVVHTPGHTPGHLCIADADEGLVYTGDHVLPALHPGLGLGGDDGSNPVLEYRRSLQRVAGLGIAEALPGHGYRFRTVAERCAQHAEHHDRRTREVAAVLVEAPAASVWQVASRLTWTAGWGGLDAFSLLSALNQTSMHIGAARADAAGADASAE